MIKGMYIWLPVGARAPGPPPAGRSAAAARRLGRPVTGVVKGILRLENGVVKGSLRLETGVVKGSLRLETARDPPGDSDGVTAAVTLGGL